jgi:DNA-binding MarR family transcriptional regulator
MIVDMEARGLAWCWRRHQLGDHAEPLSAEQRAALEEWIHAREYAPHPLGHPGHLMEELDVDLATASALCLEFVWPGWDREAEVQKLLRGGCPMGVAAILTDALQRAFHAGRKEGLEEAWAHPPAPEHFAPLTARQAQVLRFVISYFESHRFSPTIREIGGFMGIRSTNGVVDHLKALDKKGYIERMPLKSRNIIVKYAPRD